MVVAKGRAYMRVYIVQQGDTLWKIAKQHNVNFEQLKQMNSQLANPDFLMPGMEIYLPEVGGKSGKAGKKHLESPYIGPTQEMPLPTPQMPTPQMPMPQMPMPQMPMPQMPMPQIPQLPQIPQIPQLPQLPQLPMQEMPQMPMPQMPMPQMPLMMEPCFPYFVCQMIPMPWMMPQMPMHMPQMLPMEQCGCGQMPQMQPIEDCGCGQTPQYENTTDHQYYEQIRALEQQAMPMRPTPPTPFC